MKVLVTGHLGYVGTVVVPLLVSRGHVVRGLDSGLFRACSIASLPTIPGLERDVRDVERADLEGLDAVVHLAALSNDPLGAFDPEVTHSINHHASIRLAEMAREVGVRRFVFASTCSVYGSAGDRLLDEGSPFRPVTAYALSKARAERELVTMATPGFCPVVLRPGTAFGVSPMIRFDLVLNNLVAWASATGRVVLKSDGLAWRPVVHVEDISGAVAAVLEAPEDRVRGEAFNVGRTDENFRVVEIARIVAEIADAPIVRRADAASDPRSYRVDFRKIAGLPGFRPRWRATDGARSLHAAIRSLSLRRSDFEGDRYNRLAHLRRLVEEDRVGPDLRPRTDPVAGGL